MIKNKKIWEKFEIDFLKNDKPNYKKILRYLMNYINLLKY